DPDCGRRGGAVRCKGSAGRRSPRSSRPPPSTPTTGKTSGTPTETSPDQARGIGFERAGSPFKETGRDPARVALAPPSKETESQMDTDEPDVTEPCSET